MPKYKLKVVLKYYNSRGKEVSKAFDLFRDAFDFAYFKGISEFEINSIRYINI